AGIRERLVETPDQLRNKSFELTGTEPIFMVVGAECIRGETRIFEFARFFRLGARGFVAHAESLDACATAIIAAQLAHQGENGAGIESTTERYPQRHF